MIQILRNGQFKSHEVIITWYRNGNFDKLKCLIMTIMDTGNN